MPRKRLADLLREEVTKTLPADADANPGSDGVESDDPGESALAGETTAKRATKSKTARMAIADPLRDRLQADLDAQVAQVATLTAELEAARRSQTELQQQVSDLQTQLQQQLSRADTLERNLMELQMVQAELNQAKQVIQELTEIREALEQAALEHAVVETVEVNPDPANAHPDHAATDYREVQPPHSGYATNGVRSPQVPPTPAATPAYRPANSPIPATPAPSLSSPPTATVEVKPLKSSIKQLRSHSIQLGVPTRRLNNEDMGWVD